MRKFFKNATETQHTLTHTRDGGKRSRECNNTEILVHTRARARNNNEREREKKKNEKRKRTEEKEDDGERTALSEIFLLS